MDINSMKKRMFVTILIVAAACIIGAIIYYGSRGFLPFMLGVLLGSALSIGKTLLLVRTVDNALKKEAKQSAGYVNIQHILRLLLTAAVLLIAALIPQINLWGAIAGVLSYNLAIYSIGFSRKTKKAKGSIGIEEDLSPD